MLNAIKEYFAIRAGKAQAEHEIKHLSTGYFSAAQLAAKPDPRLEERGGRTPYARAYDERWRDEGYRDALAGRFRSAKFENVSYDGGWIEGMRKRHQEGFRHEHLDAEFEQLVRRYHEKDLWPSFGVRGED